MVGAPLPTGGDGDAALERTKAIFQKMDTNSDGSLSKAAII